MQYFLDRGFPRGDFGILRMNARFGIDERSDVFTLLLGGLSLIFMWITRARLALFGHTQYSFGDIIFTFSVFWGCLRQTFWLPWFIWSLQLVLTISAIALRPGMQKRPGVGKVPGFAEHLWAPIIIWGWSHGRADELCAAICSSS
jgi:hypothetical protein